MLEPLYSQAPYGLVIATDLDGTFLDHNNYSWKPASPALEKLKQEDIPLIINTSKTREEVIKLQGELGITYPFIIENGSAIFFPGEQESSHQLLGSEITFILETLATLKERYDFKFTGISEWSVEYLVELTHLDPESARLAKDRKFSEAILWQDSDEKLALFKDQLKEHKLNCLQGGRFLHIIGLCNKGEAMLALLQRREQETGMRQLSVALGDSANDIEMLASADIPIWVKTPKHDYPSTDFPVLCCQSYGPQGWNEAVEYILNIFSKEEKF